MTHLHICDTMHSYMWHVSLRYVPWLTHMCDMTHSYAPWLWGSATCSRLLKITGLFCKRALWKRRYFAQETYNFKEPTNRSCPIASCFTIVLASLAGEGRRVTSSRLFVSCQLICHRMTQSRNSLSKHHVSLSHTKHLWTTYHTPLLLLLWPLRYTIRPLQQIQGGQDS